ncbi:ATP-binding protein, partial [Streptomyces goshikiensis]|uniref:ATP-binding protein n=1 Tax=Streptomyces goshikiensis TaxID=1942 RepID=UPI0036DA1AE5
MRNFRGIRNIVIDDFADTSLVLLSGRNGTGKSTLLLGLSLAWEIPANFDDTSIVGPWGPAASVVVKFRLTDFERGRLADA